ncbi:hypothetical protein DXG01_006237 [Tephrocybe rancida]|nr:hypothetical protein DXG01_006237 [Tephrocybe rancida]
MHTVLDTLDMIFISHAVYHYAILHPENGLSVFRSPVWSVMAQTFATTYSDIIIRCRNDFIQFSVFIAQIIETDSFPTTPKGIAIFYTGLSGGVLCDVLIASALCLALVRLKTGFTQTNNAITMFMIYTINTGVLTSICMLATIISFAVKPAIPVYLAMFFLLSKVYFVSLLAALNNRAAIWEKCFGTTAIMMSTGKHSFSTGSTTRQEPSNSIVMVNIDRTIDTTDSFPTGKDVEHF